ncbi:unnamed protein product, partial [Protopolystoma xenopodis]
MREMMAVKEIRLEHFPIDLCPSDFESQGEGARGNILAVTNNEFSLSNTNNSSSSSPLVVSTRNDSFTSSTLVPLSSLENVHQLTFSPQSNRKSLDPGLMSSHFALTDKGSHLISQTEARHQLARLSACLRECDLLASLNHPGLVRFLGAEEAILVQP